MKLSTSMIVLSFFALAACGDDGDGDKTSDTSTATDAAATETSGDTSVVEETTIAPETVEETTEPTETVAETTETVEETTEPTDTTPEDGDATSSCTYFEEPRLIECGGSLTQVFYWISIDEGCDPYYSRGEDKYPTMAALAAGENCDATCEWRLTNAVMVIGCVGGNRTEYMTYTAEGCATVYEVPSGLLRNICQWQERACFCKDTDGDYISDGRPDGEALGGSDNCEDVPNPNQLDADGDNFGDACDPDIDGDTTPNGSDDDIDGDGKLNAADACPEGFDPPMDCDANPETADEICDSDDDTVSDACDVCPYDDDDDIDNDAVCGDVDNCPLLANPRTDCDNDDSTDVEQCDGDFDGSGDACDAE